MYDARSSTGDKGDLIFGVATLVVVGVAFVAAWFGAGLLNGDTDASQPLPVAVNVSGETALAQAFPSADEQRLLRAFSQLDATRFAALESSIASAGDREAQIEALGEAVGFSLLDNAQHLARVSAADINAMLDSAGRALNAARTSGNALCLGSTYAALEDMSPNRAEREVKRLLERSGFDLESVHAMGVTFQADLLEMTVRAKANPQRHGKLTPQDEAAFQSMLMSFMMDPAFMGMAMAENPTDAIEKMNVCEIGAKVISEVRQLPDGTKARAWASVFDMPEVKQGLRDAQNLAF